MISPILQVQNLSEKPIVFRWKKMQYPIQPGGSTLVPFEAAVIKLGDPRSAVEVLHFVDPVSGEHVRVSTREEEINRICVMWGVYYKRERLKEVVPKLRITNPGETEEIIFPAQDVDANAVRTYTVPRTETEYLRTELEAVKRQLQFVSDMQENAEAGKIKSSPSNGVTTGAIPVDNPTSNLTGAGNAKSARV